MLLEMYALGGFRKGFKVEVIDEQSAKPGGNLATFRVEGESLTVGSVSGKQLISSG